jgi:hypothetical protein
MPRQGLALIAVICLSGVALAPTVAGAVPEPMLPEIDISVSATGIVPLPREGLHPVFEVFDRYTKIVAPNGKPIHIVIEPGYADHQAVYARKVLINHLTNIPGSLYGADKTTIANSIANMDAILFLFRDTESFEGHIRNLVEAGVNGQDLRAYETILEGTAGYMAQVDPTRDASYEEIMHFVQGYGIEPAHPTLSQKLFDAFWDARARDVYNLDYDETFEYFICGFEAYFDMWRHDPVRDGTREDEYVPISNARLKVVDPKMYEIVEEFMGTHWHYLAEIAPEYQGTFSLTHDEEVTYTNKSQFLRKAALTGTKNSNLTGNNADNTLLGNSGDNILIPRGGFDVVDGGPGTDTVVFSGDRTEYLIRPQEGRLIVDGIDYDRDGQNILINIEKLRFGDQTVATSGL